LCVCNCTYSMVRCVLSKGAVCANSLHHQCLCQQACWWASRFVHDQPPNPIITNNIPLLSHRTCYSTTHTIRLTGCPTTLQVCRRSELRHHQQQQQPDSGRLQQRPCDAVGHNVPRQCVGVHTPHWCVSRNRCGEVTLYFLVGTSLVIVGGDWKAMQTSL
jgi:hypothetical protein